MLSIEEEKQNLITSDIKLVSYSLATTMCISFYVTFTAFKSHYQAKALVQNTKRIHNRRGFSV